MVEILVISFAVPTATTTGTTTVVIAIVTDVVVVRDQKMMMLMVVDGTFKVEAVAALKLDGSVEKQRFPHGKDSRK